MLSCTEAPPPTVPPSTTSHSQPSGTSTSTVWRSGPLNSYYSFVHFQCSLNYPKPSITLKCITHHLEANPATPTMTLNVMREEEEGRLWTEAICESSVACSMWVWDESSWCKPTFRGGSCRSRRSCITHATTVAAFPACRLPDQHKLIGRKRTRQLLLLLLRKIELILVFHITLYIDSCKD